MKAIDPLINEALNNGQIQRLLAERLASIKIDRKKAQEAGAVFKALNFDFRPPWLQIAFPHALFAVFYRSRQQELAERLLKMCLGDQITIQYKDAPAAPAMKPVAPAPDPFSAFIVSEKNRLAFEAAKALASGASPGLLILHGPSGSGKSHLLTLIEASLSNHYGANSTVRDQAINFLSASPLFDFQAPIRSLLLDNVQEISDSPSMQRLLAMYIERASETNKSAPIVLVFADENFQALIPRLARKLAGGLKVELCKADLPMRMQYAEIKCSQLGLPRQYINAAARHTQHIPDLEGLLQKLAFYAKITGQFLPPQEIEKMALPTNGQPDWQIVIQNVARKFQVRPADILGPNRNKNLARARQIAMFICRLKLGLSYPEIGRLFGGRDHSTVMHGINKIHKLRTTDRDIDILLTELEQGVD